MTDQLVRAAFHQRILRYAHSNPSTFVLDELGLKHGEVRADIAVLNGKFLGYEIKTDNDTLVRLSSQVIAYGEVFDKAFIISGKKHLNRVTEQVPGWWGIYEIKKYKENIFYFSCVRKGKINQRKNPYSIAQLLWKDEAVDILTSYFNCKVKVKATKHELYNILIGKCTTKELGEIVLKYLKLRQGWRTSPIQL